MFAIGFRILAVVIIMAELVVELASIISGDLIGIFNLGVTHLRKI